MSRRSDDDTLSEWWKVSVIRRGCDDHRDILHRYLRLMLEIVCTWQKRSDKFYVVDRVEINAKNDESCSHEVLHHFALRLDCDIPWRDVAWRAIDENRRHWGEELWEKNLSEGRSFLSLILERQWREFEIESSQSKVALKEKDTGKSVPGRKNPRKEVYLWCGDSIRSGGSGGRGTQRQVFEVQLWKDQL